MFGRFNKWTRDRAQVASRVSWAAKGNRRRVPIAPRNEAKQAVLSPNIPIHQSDYDRDWEDGEEYDCHSDDDIEYSSDISIGEAISRQISEQLDAELQKQIDAELDRAAEERQVELDRQLDEQLEQELDALFLESLAGKAIGANEADVGIGRKLANAMAGTTNECTIDGKMGGVAAAINKEIQKAIDEYKAKS